MPELRVDPLTGLRSIIAGERLDRPGGGFAVDPLPPLDPDADPFLAGHEDRTPPELHRVGDPWQVRVVPNLYPALGPGEEPAAHPDRDLFFATAATGAHEVIVNSPRPVQTLGELTVDELAVAMEAWKERMRAHREAAYVHVIVNERREAGASLPHTHAQLYALDFVPAGVARERERAGAYATRTMGSNLLGDLVQEEVRLRDRLVAYDAEAVLIAPYASRVPYQLMLAPRTPHPRFEEDDHSGAALLHDALNRLARHLGAPPPLNLWVRTAPAGAWRIDILPRLAHLAGLELGVGVGLNIVAPERAAADLRNA